MRLRPKTHTLTRTWLDMAQCYARLQLLRRPLSVVDALLLSIFVKDLGIIVSTTRTATVPLSFTKRNASLTHPMVRITGL